MALIVQKYGGKTVATLDLIKRAAERIVKTKRAGNQVIVVVSAMGNTTNELEREARMISSNPDKRELDMLLATGEQKAIALMAMAIQSLGEKAISLTGAQAGIKSNVSYTQAKITRIYPRRLLEELAKGKIPVVAGFQGVADNNEITTLGRGGSDLTAVALAAALKADICEKYTDEEGVFVADPKIIPNAKKLNVLSYDEMIEMASVGARVLQARSVLFAKKHNVPIRVRPDDSDDIGTLITKEVKRMEDAVISSIVHQEDIAKITIVGVPDRPGIAAIVFGRLAEKEIGVDMIVQNVSEEGKTDITFTIPEKDFEAALEVTKETKSIINAKEVKGDKDIGKISVIGVGLRSDTTIPALMFGALSEKGINIEMISTSEIRISCIIRREALKEAVKALYEKFEMSKRLAGA